MPFVSISRAISINATADPERPAVTCGAFSITRAELDRRTNRLARQFAELGVTEGRFVTIALPNSVEFYLAAVAAWKLGAIPQPVSHRLPDRERQAIVDLADPALVVGTEPTAHAGHRVLAELPIDDPAVDDSELPDVVATAWKAPTSGGSTGRPKLIVAADPGMVNHGEPAQGVRFNGVVGIPGPLYHNAPFAFSCQALFQGNHVVVLPKFDAQATLEMIDDHGVDWILLVPTMMQRIWRLPTEIRTRYDLSSLATVWHMAAPCPPWLKEAWIEWLGAEKIWELYAGTEAQAVTVIRGDEYEAHRGSVGRVISGEMKVFDPESLSELPCGVQGEVFMRSTRGATYHYLGAEVRRTPDGWESLGDMGWFDGDGYLYLGDRRADMILSGGANIYPAEVEAAIDEHPQVRSNAVIGLPDDDLGSVLHAVIHADGEVTAEELRAFLTVRLVRYKVPRSFEFIDEPVRDDAGKVRRSALRADRAG